MPDAIQTELLYFNHNFSAGVPLHSHSHCQLEYCIVGILTGSDGNATYHLKAGDFWLIEPGKLHKFAKNQQDVEYLSIKFNTNYRVHSQIGCSTPGRFYLDEICRIIDGKTSCSAYTAEGKKIVEYLLAGVLNTLAPEPEHASAFSRHIQQFVCNFGAAATINDLAESFQLNRAEFKYLFQKETGNGKIKKYLDAILLKMVEQALKYSDMPIRQIAEEFHFSSIYAFSRYYKHNRGITPMTFRESVQNRRSSRKREGAQTKKDVK